MIVRSRRRRESLGRRLFTWFCQSNRTLSTIVLDESGFQALLEKERHRADRREIEFCLIEFTSTRVELIPNFDHLLEAFRHRLRITDELGMLDQKLCVLLPDTPGDAGCKVANQLVEMASEYGIKLIPNVFVYPDDKIGKADTGSSISSRNNNVADLAGGFGITNDRVKSIDNKATSIAGEPQPLKFSESVSITKRCFDIVASASGIIAFSPVLFAAAVLIKMNGKGPILFRQLREGKDGKTFTILKFRTMVVGAEDQQEQFRHLNEQSGPAFKIEKDPRLTRVGALLRKTCVDELPQLFNVLRGEMSMVGPRPLPIHESQACSGWQRRRLNVLPGMTCIWQVNGSRNVEFSDWMRMDLDYIQKRGLWFDLKILWKTAAVAIFARGSV